MSNFERGQRLIEYLSYDTEATMSGKADAKSHSDAIHQRDVWLFIPCYGADQFIFIVEYLHHITTSTLRADSNTLITRTVTADPILSAQDLRQ